MRNLKYIQIILLSFILCESNAFAQKKKNSKSTKRVATRMMNRPAVVSKTTTTKTNETTAPVAEPQPEPTDVATFNLKKTEIETLKSQNQVLKDKMTEKQTEYQSIDDKIEEINEKYINLEQKQNRSKNTCEAISIKKMDQIKGWLIASVSSSGVGTVANATATTTSFLQKDNNQVDKHNQKVLDRATEKEKKNENNLVSEEVNAKTIDYEKQEKINKNLSTASKISSIVGTVASGAATITSAVATGLVSSISKQVKKCKETF